MNAETLETASFCGDRLAAIFHYLIHPPVGAVLVKVEQTELLDIRLESQAQDIGVHGMTPVQECGVLPRRVFCIVEEQVGFG